MSFGSDICSVKVAWLRVLCARVLFAVAYARELRARFGSDAFVVGRNRLWGGGVGVCLDYDGLLRGRYGDVGDPMRVWERYGRLTVGATRRRLVRLTVYLVKGLQDAFERLHQGVCARVQCAWMRRVAQAARDYLRLDMCERDVVAPP